MNCRRNPVPFRANNKSDVQRFALPFLNFEVLELPEPCWASRRAFNALQVGRT
jgi:hypothetical protein